MAGFSLKKYRKLAKGFRGRSKNCPSAMIPRVHKSLQKQYIGRKLRPRIMRRNWIVSINAAVRQHQLHYSRFINGLNNSNIKLNRKILADLAINEPYSFKSVVDQIKVQNSILPKNKYTIEQMVRRNLITTAKLNQSQYDKIPNDTIGLRYHKNSKKNQ